MAKFFWKTKNVQTLKLLLVKYIGKDFSDLKTYKRPLFFKLRVIELAILFNWFLNRSPEIKANENSTKLPTSNTNFSKKVARKVTITL